MKKKYKLKYNPGGIWTENDESTMKIGRIIAEDEILDGEPFSHYLVGQERYWGELFDEPGIIKVDTTF
jgi:hypothetical protein